MNKIEEEILQTSDSGKRIIQYVSPILQNSLFVQRVFEKIGTEFDQLHEWAADIQLQLFPQTATWALSYWEEAYGLPVNELKDDEFRRNRILSTIQAKTQQPLTRERFKTIISSAAGDLPVEIISHFDEAGQELTDYTFKVLIKALEQDSIDNELVKFVKQVIYEMKPAHLSYEFFLRVLLTLEMDVSHATKMVLLQQIATEISYSYAKQETIRFKAGFIGPGTYPFTPNADGRYLDGSWGLDGSFFSDGENPEGMKHYVSQSEKFYTHIKLLVFTAVYLDYESYTLLKTQVKTLFDFSYSNSSHMHVKAGLVGAGAFPFAESNGLYLDGSSVMDGSFMLDGKNPLGINHYMKQSDKLSMRTYVQNNLFNEEVV
ncbi:putative phage tail protein [Chengkuizengella sp. SCS-71B]|uniref:putative phage tail protein n=1 Tax=Chengkuizengella sp. SCS-71B TaxID=3115290 RepID=UPI0032C2228F